MEILLSDHLNIEYCKLHFSLKMLKESRLPMYKTSALRGGLGEILLRENCLRDRQCDGCTLKSECIVQRILYSKMLIQPDFMGKGDSVGYVINCEDKSTDKKEGDILEFEILLFGRMIAYYGVILQAYMKLGNEGLGSDDATYEIVQVTDSRKRVLYANGIEERKPESMKLSDYVEYRRRKLRLKMEMHFHTPLCVKYKKEIQKEFNIEAIMYAIERRLYMLNCYEGVDSGRIKLEEHIPKLTGQLVETVSMKRYSSRHGDAMWLNGICGMAVIENVDDMAQELLLAGELIHVGKNTSFGFGRYTLMN